MLPLQLSNYFFWFIIYDFNIRLTVALYNCNPYPCIILAHKAQLLKCLAIYHFELYYKFAWKLVLILRSKTITQVLYNVIK